MSTWWHVWGSSEYIYLPLSTWIHRLIFYIWMVLCGCVDLRLVSVWRYGDSKSSPATIKHFCIFNYRVKSDYFCYSLYLVVSFSNFAVSFTCASCEMDVNECASNPCQHAGTCEDQINAFMCDCSPGFTGGLFTCHHLHKYRETHDLRLWLTAANNVFLPLTFSRFFST